MLKMDRYSHGPPPPPPLPPKPPMKYTMASTDATAEFRLNNNRMRPGDRPTSVSELVDRRPSQHPLGPRQPGLPTSFNHQPQNKFIGVYASSDMPAVVPSPEDDEFGGPPAPPLPPLPVESCESRENYDQASGRPTVDLYSRPLLPAHQRRLPARPIVTYNTNASSLTSETLNAYPDDYSSVSSVDSSVPRIMSTDTAYWTNTYYHGEPNVHLSSHMHHALNLQPDIYPNQDWTMNEEAAEIPFLSPSYQCSGEDDDGESPALMAELRQAVNRQVSSISPRYSPGYSPGHSPNRYSQVLTPPMQRSPIRRGSPGKNLTVDTSPPLARLSPATASLPAGFSPKIDISSYDHTENESEDDFLDDINVSPSADSRRRATRLSLDGGSGTAPTRGSFHAKRRSLPGKTNNNPFNDFTELENTFNIVADDANSSGGIPRSISSVLPTSKFDIKRRPVTMDTPPSETATNSLQSSTRSAVDNSLMIKLGLPEIPDSIKTFDSKRLSSRDYERCREIWSLSQIALWLQGLQTGQLEITQQELTKSLVGLFTHYIPTLNWVHAERIAEDALKSMTVAGFVSFNEASFVQFDSRNCAVGVFPLLTGQGCYTGVHGATEETTVSSLRCYSSKCSRTIPLKGNLLPNVDLKELADASNGDWASYWKIGDEQIMEIDKKEAKKQYAIHELIVGEESYVRDLITLVSIFGDSLQKMNVPPIMTDQEEFWEHSFGSVKVLVECNSEHLLRPFKYRQQQQGPFIEGVADLILGWLGKSREPYLNYADSYLYTDRRIRREKEVNPAFASWLERASKDPRAKGVPYSFYFHRAIPRLARYGLLLRTIQKTTMTSDSEWQLLEKCITECDALTGECNKRLERVEKTMEILDLQEQLQFKSPEVTANLRMKDPRRKVIRRGDVLRRGEYKLDWIEAHIILLDNFLILSKIRKGANGTRYYISRRPIPMDLLVLETADGDGVTKSSSSKFGVGTFTSHVSPENKRISRQFFSGTQSPTKLQPDTSPQIGQASITALDDDKEVMYPLRITHLGQNGNRYTLYAPTSLDRERWRDAIVQAKREYSSAVYALNAEPFRLRVLADGVFGYAGSGPKLPVFAPATAIDRALQESETSKDKKRRPLAASHINCATSFIFADGLEYCLIGLDYGVYIKESQPNAHWRRCIEISRVTQISVIEGLNILILLAAKALVYYNLDTVISESLKKESKVVIPGYKLSKHREVGFFTVGRMKDRTLVFYKRREGTSSIFKVLEPIREKGSQQRRSKVSFTRGIGVGSTEYFREAERFYVPTDSHGLNLFKSSFAIQTSKGFEVMSLDLKLGQSVPVMASITGQVLHQALRSTANSLKGYTVESFKKKIEGSKPLGMFRVSDKQLMLCYEDMALFCDNHGNMMATTIIEFVCRAKEVAVQHPYLIAFDDEMVEVRRLDKGGQLKQVIAGKDIRAIDTKEGQIKIALAHPELANRQLIVELVGNEFVVEDDNSSLADL